MKRRKSGNLLFLLVIVAALWYTQLDDSRKRFYQNLLRQLPFLPARYMV